MRWRVWNERNYGKLNWKMSVVAKLSVYSHVIKNDEYLEFDNFQNECSKFSYTEKTNEGKRNFPFKLCDLIKEKTFEYKLIL